MKFLGCLGIVILLQGVAVAAAGQRGWTVPTVMRKLQNGLLVVVSEDHSAPTMAFAFPTALVSGWNPKAGPDSLTFSST